MDSEILPELSRKHFVLGFFNFSDIGSEGLNGSFVIFVFLDSSSDEVVPKFEIILFEI